ncbi:hypothetical protein, partial [Xanthocytophaga agilis]
MGPSRILKVKRGDKLSASVYVFYSTDASTNTGSDLSLFLQTTGNNHRQQPQATTTGNNHRQQPQATTTGNNHRQQPQATTTG